MFWAKIIFSLVVMKYFKLWAPLIGAFLLFFFFNKIPDAITFKSWESKGPTGGEVYNEISYKKEQDKEIWMMRQSHFGPHPNKKTWDRVALIMNDGNVSFYQLAPGEMDFKNFKEIPKKVDCLNCHSNGPRLIRPDPESSLPLFQRLKITWWNYKIKNTGHIKQQEQNQFQTLNLRACTRCHNNQDGPRSFLTEKNRDTILFLVEKKLMPPNRFLKKKELIEVKKFIAGF